MSRPIRIATVKETGHKYIVRAFFPDTQKYRLWGEVQTATFSKRFHGEDLLLDRADVDVIDGQLTRDLHNELVEQGFKAARVAGRDVQLVTRRR
jgi:hypothetical protein